MKLDRCIRKRQLKGKATNAILNGNPISHDKLKEKIERYISFTDRIFDTTGGSLTPGDTCAVGLLRD